MSGDAHDFNNMGTRAVIRFFFPLQGKAPKEIHAILKETLGEHAPLYATVKKTEWDSLNVVFFHLRCALKPDDSKQ
jgi:hypothetical protein